MIKFCIAFLIFMILFGEALMSTTFGMIFCAVSGVVMLCVAAYEELRGTE